MIGLGTIINVIFILVGSALGVLIGHRIPERTRRTVTDGIGLVVLVVGGLNVVAITDSAYVEAVGGGGALLVVLAAILIGGILGSALRIEERLEGFGGWLMVRFRRGKDSGDGSRFIEGFVDASLVFCIGPLAILGSLSDGLGRGIDQLALRSILDGFASLAFAATLGWGVAASAIAVGVWQGLLTVLGYFLGAFLSAALIASITATGGVLLLGVGMRIIGLKQIQVGNLLPALLVAPIITAAVAAIMH